MSPYQEALKLLFSSIKDPRNKNVSVLSMSRNASITGPDKQHFIWLTWIIATVDNPYGSYPSNINERVTCSQFIDFYRGKSKEELIAIPMIGEYRADFVLDFFRE